MRNANPSNTVMNTESTLLAPVNSALSAGLVKSTLIIFDPDNTCSISPAVTMGPIPNSTSVPRLDANITLNGPKGSFTLLVWCIP